jgi:DCN1-like protein 1/2
LIFASLISRMGGTKAASKKRQRMWNSGRPKSKKKPPSIDETAAEKLFQDIADEDDPHVASMEGISKLCDQLELDPLEDIRILVLLWKLGANEKPAQINKDEWMQGCNKLQVDSVDKFQALLPSLDTGFLEQAEFKDFYKVRSECG